MSTQEVFGQGGEIDEIEERMAGTYQEKMIVEKGSPSGKDMVGCLPRQYLGSLLQNGKKRN
jgi:hypothetical protein